MDNYKVNLKVQIDDFIDSYVDEGLVTDDQLKGIGIDPVDVQKDIAASHDFLNEIQWLKELIFDTIVYCVNKDFENYNRSKTELQNYCTLSEQLELFMTFESLEDGYKSW